MSRRRRWMTPIGRWTIGMGHGLFSLESFAPRIGILEIEVPRDVSYIKEKRGGVTCVGSAVIHQSPFQALSEMATKAEVRVQGFNEDGMTWQKQISWMINFWKAFSLHQTMAWVKDSNGYALQLSVQMPCSFRTTKMDSWRHHEDELKLWQSLKPRGSFWMAFVGWLDRVATLRMLCRSSLGTSTAGRVSQMPSRCHIRGDSFGHPQWNSGSTPRWVHWSPCRAKVTAADDIWRGHGFSWCELGMSKDRSL